MFARSHLSSRGVWVLGILLSVPCWARDAEGSSVDARIRYYARKVREHSRLYPAYAQLGAAYLDKARQTHDPALLNKARTLLNRSLEIQPNFPAMKTMTALCNFTHRFEEALEWGRRALQASPNDAAVTALLVEAYLGLGHTADAERLLPVKVGTEPTGFYTAVAQAHWLASKGRGADAAAAFVKAGEFARAQNEMEPVVWSYVSAAGVLIDADQAQRAKPHLELASSLDPDNISVRVHEAELFEAEDELAEALAIYEAVLAETNDPLIHARAFKIARQLGREQHVRQHFEAAEQGFLRAIEAGEIYTLGALARLYEAADVNLDRALALARQNLQYKRDAQARATFASIQARHDRAGKHPQHIAVPKE